MADEWILLGEKNSLKKLRRSRAKKTPVIIATVLPLLLLIYVIYMSLFYPGYGKNYSLQLGARGDNDSHNKIYVASWEGSPQVRYGSRHYRMLDGKAEIMFKPQIALDRAQAYVSINFTGNNTLYIKNNNTWSVYWNPEWDEYALLYSFNVSDEDMAYLHYPANLEIGDVVQVRVNPEYNSPDHGDIPVTLRDWLAENEDESLHFYNLGFRNYENDALGYAPGPTTIEATLRGTHSFYVYLRDSLNLTVWKKDFNNYDGKDDMSITLSDLDGNVIYSDMLYDDDDGNITLLDENNESVLRQDDPVQIQSLYFYYSEMRQGVYLLTIASPRGESSIVNLSINTDKIVVADKINVLSQLRLYTETADERDVRVTHSSIGTNQNLTIQGDELQVISLMRNESGQAQTIKIKGKNWLEAAKGNFILEGNLQFAFDKENYFRAAKYELNDKDPIFIILTGRGYPVLSQNITIQSASNEINWLIVNVKR